MGVSVSQLGGKETVRRSGEPFPLAHVGASRVGQGGSVVTEQPSSRQIAAGAERKDSYSGFAPESEGATAGARAGRLS